MKKITAIVLVIVMLLGVSGCSKPKAEYLLIAENGTKVMIGLEKKEGWTIDAKQSNEATLNKNGEEIIYMTYVEDLTESINTLTVGDEIKLLKKEKKNGNDVYFFAYLNKRGTFRGFVLQFKGSKDGIGVEGRDISEKELQEYYDMLSFRKVS